jgi:hypothetical protein
MMKVVTCNGKQFAIINGQRVWLETPPPDVLADIRYDQHRAANWQRMSSVTEELQ